MATGSGFMSSKSAGENKYWITGKDIHKTIITTMIQDYLGPDASVRSYTNNGEDGFLISTPGDCLTDEQIDEICHQSKQMWERQAAERTLIAGPSHGLKRPLHKPVVISRARPRSMSSAPDRRSLGHRGSGSGHGTASLTSPPNRSRNYYAGSSTSHANAQAQAPRHYHSQQAYPGQQYDARDPPDDRFAPYHLSPISPSHGQHAQHAHRRQNRSVSGSQGTNDYVYDDPWGGELPPPIGAERSQSLRS